METEISLLEKVQAGEIRAFHTLFSEFQPELKSYLYRLLANRNDMEDMVQDVFIVAYENIRGFRGEASLKSWVFTIATNRARRYLKERKRWSVDTLEETRQLAHSQPIHFHNLQRINQSSPYGAFDLREHIDYCFTCVGQMLPLEQQIALILKDLYRFRTGEIAAVTATTESRVKHLVRDARQTMQRIFAKTCALVSKQGVCDQCSQLNGMFNPEQERQAALMAIEWANQEDDQTQAELLKLRSRLVRGIDPLRGQGNELHDHFLLLNHLVNGTDQRSTT